MASKSKERKSRSSAPSKNKQDIVICPAIIDAAMYGKLDELKEIALADPKNLQAREPDGWTIAHWAARRGHLDVLSYVADRAPTLLSAQADDGSTPAHYAASYGHDSVLNLLGDRDPGSLMVNDSQGNSAAHDATKHNRLTTLKLLVERCPSLIYGMNKDQNRPCDFAVREEIKQFLKESEKASMVPAVQLQNLAKETRVLNAQNAVLAFYCRNYWDPIDRSRLVLLKPPANKEEHHMEWQSVSAEFLRTMSKANILAVYRFQDREMHDGFISHRDQIKAACKDHWSEANMEKWVFSTGLNMEESLRSTPESAYPFLSHKSASAPYGDGIYLVREASLCSDDVVSLGDGTKQMLLSRAVTGRYSVGKSGMDKPSLLPSSNTKTFDSMVDNVAEPMTFVLPTASHVVPAYLISYRD